MAEAAQSSIRSLARPPSAINIPPTHSAHCCAVFIAFDVFEASFLVQAPRSFKTLYFTAFAATCQAQAPSRSKQGRSVLVIPSPF